MNTIIIRALIFLGIIGLFMVLLSQFFMAAPNNQLRYEAMSSFPIKPNEMSEERESITFIMGEDNDSENPYFTEALNYYTHNPDAQTNHLVSHCRSLLDVRNYLEEQAPKNGLPWGKINVVLHSNEWSGLGVPVLNEGNRSNAQSIWNAQSTGDFACLENEVVDGKTEMILHGCGLGKNAEILKAISYAFGGDYADNERPIVRSSKYFIFYQSLKYKGEPQNCQRYLAQPWYAYYKFGYRPGDIKLARQLQSNYPNDTLNWRDALNRTAPRFVGDTYHHTFTVPIIWTVTYADESERPDLSSKSAQQEWLEDQADLQEAILNFGIPMNKFNWLFKNVEYTFEDGITEPGIKAVGYCTILCVLKILTEPEQEGQAPLAIIPEITDERYYATEKP